MSTPHNDNPLTDTEMRRLAALEARVRDALDTQDEAGNALADIRDARLFRDAHQTFEAYLRDRWGATGPRADQLMQPAGRADQPPADDVMPPTGEVLAPAPSTTPTTPPIRRDDAEARLRNAWERARHEFGHEDVTAVDIRVTVHRRPPVAGTEPWAPAQPDPAALGPRLRWLLTQSSGTIADVAHQLETGGMDLDEGTRQQLRDDVQVLDEELAMVKALLLGPIDWDPELERLLGGEIPPFDEDADDDE